MTEPGRFQGGDGIYDPADYSDRLPLGLKGTISEAELHLIKGRLTAGIRHKAAKGELRIPLPASYDYAPDASVVTSADEAVSLRFRQPRDLRPGGLKHRLDPVRSHAPP